MLTLGQFVSQFILLPSDELMHVRSRTDMLEYLFGISADDRVTATMVNAVVSMAAIDELSQKSGVPADHSEKSVRVAVLAVITGVDSCLVSLNRIVPTADDMPGQVETALMAPCGKGHVILDRVWESLNEALDASDDSDTVCGAFCTAVDVLRDFLPDPAA